MTLAGIGFSTADVGSLLVLHLSWVSPAISQHLGVTAIKVLSVFLFWPTLACLLLSAFGSGRMRFLGIGTTLITGLWWFSLSMAATIFMGAPPLSRHPTNFLIPEGHVRSRSLIYAEQYAHELKVN